MSTLATTQTVQASEAKTNFLRLLDDVARGETIIITRHGHRIARIIPDSEEAAYAEQARQAIETIRAIRTRVKPISVAQILADKNEGRM
jgi:prevent-host-death family protein